MDEVEANNNDIHSDCVSFSPVLVKTCLRSFMLIVPVCRVS